MKILIFAHSGAAGGAENALRHLVNMLLERHHLELVLPSLDQEEAAYYQSLGLRCHLLAIPPSIPQLSSALLHYASIDFTDLAAQWWDEEFDLCISNTIATLHGGILSTLMGVPHLTYAHEYLDDEELLPNSLSAPSYIAMIEEASSAVMSCSNFVASQFSIEKQAHLNVLEPCDYSLPALAREFDGRAIRVLQVIGSQSARKNPQFAVTLVKALRLRGMEVQLDIIGPAHTASSKVVRVINKRQTSARAIDRLADPYAINLDKQVVTLVCANTEPYGLTIPESLRRGIPVISSRSGGPQDILPGDLLYEVENLDQCARLVERVFSCYEDEVLRARTLYEGLSRRVSRKELVEKLDQSLLTLSEPSIIELRAQRLVDRVRCVAEPPVDLETLARNISVVASQYEPDWTAEHVQELIESEAQHQGQAVGRDVMKFDVVPFSMSDQMTELYQKGCGLAIELAATFDDPARLQMASYIACALDEVQVKSGRPPKVLALGDGLGIDALRLAACSLDVSYADFDQSNMSRIATLNFESARALNTKLKLRVTEGIQEKYDVVVCLEVIEHVPRPEDFAEVIAGYLVDGGLLFISDCFNGLEDRWPTHLLENERFAGMLHFLLRRSFVSVGANRVPYGKPFLFRKVDRPFEKATLTSLFTRDLTAHLIRNQLDIGI